MFGHHHHHHGGFGGYGYDNYSGFDIWGEFIQQEYKIQIFCF